MGNNTSSWKDAIGIERTIQFARCAHRHDLRLPFVSIGSGNGHIEKLIEDELKVPVICVDPKPGEWRENRDTPQTIHKQPAFADASALVIAKPSLKNGCHMLIFWSHPNNEPYDMSAIKLLEPRTCVIVYDASGAAGSPLMHSWIRASGGETRVPNTHPQPSFYPKIGYHTLGQFKRVSYTDFDSFHHVIALFRRADCPEIQGLELPVGLIDPPKPVEHFDFGAMLSAMAEAKPDDPGSMDLEKH